MELINYQKQVISNLEEYLTYYQKEKSVSVAFNKYWEDKIGPYNPLANEGMRPYKQTIKNAAQICLKVPTAGGKTFIAINALKSIFNSYNSRQPKAVVWLVPWTNLLEQTKEAFINPIHPYHQQLNNIFENKVKVYDKEQLLQGANFNPSNIYDQTNIFIFNFSSIRINNQNKEDRKIYKENGQLDVFSILYEDDKHILEGSDKSSLINIIRWLNPVVVIDESHNAESELSIEMLNNLNPSFILELTATPKESSNIISFVNAFELKKENMVKLPVIIYNHNDKNDVISSALHLQKKLEIESEIEYKNTKKYIRPIVLFQAQPKTSDDNTTFERIKEKLIELKIPEEQIKIKTASINELKDIDLMSVNCKVRYIITVNALKEGWDCPFAYILASLADKSSNIDVEQILGRVLRQPYVMKHQNPLLNLSYVLTSSSKFNETLQNIVKSLQKSGFSEKDYRAQNFEYESSKNKTNHIKPELTLISMESSPNIKNDINNNLDIDTSLIPFNSDEETNLNEQIHTITQIAFEEQNNFESYLNTMSVNMMESIPLELENKVKLFKIKEEHINNCKNILLPQFFISVKANHLFAEESENVLLTEENLLEDFELHKKDIEIKFDDISSELFKVDIEETQKDTFVASIAKIDQAKTRDTLIEYILSSNKNTQIRELTIILMQHIGKVVPISDKDIRLYVNRIIETMSSEQMQNILKYEHSFAKKIKEKIKELSIHHAQNKFQEFINKDKIIVKNNFIFKERIQPNQTCTNITKSLYEKEGYLNPLEEKIILELSSLSNISFWHRNLSRGKGFNINGFINHYPDFIIYTKSGKIIIVEVKGDDRDNSDSQRKNSLGKQWANLSGNTYKYFMVFDTKKIDDTLTLDELKDTIKAL